MSQESTYSMNINSDVKILQPDWVNPPTVADLKQNLSDSMPNHRRHVNNVNKWLDALRAELKIRTMEGRSKVQPKLVRKQSEWRYAALEEPFLSTDEMFIVNPVTHADVDSAKQNAMVLNKQFRVDIPKVKFINKYIRTAVNMGTVIVKLAWESRIANVVEEVPVYTQTLEELYTYLQQLVQSGQMAEQEAMQVMQSGQPMQIGVEPQLVEKEIVNRPVIEVRDTRNVIIDPSCEGDISKAQFMIDKFLTDISTLKKDGRYSNLENILEKDYSVSDFQYYEEWKDDPNFRFQDKPRQKLVVYEYWGYWDINNEGITKPIVAAWVGDVMIRLEENPYPDEQLPFVVVQYLPPDYPTIYGEADASLIKENQDIIGAVTRAMIDLMGRSANAQQGIRKDLLDPLNMIKFRKGEDFEYNPVANASDALITTKLPEIPRSALEMIQLQNNEAEALSGVKAFSGGISSQALGDMLALDTLVPLANGMFTTVGALQIGDKLIGKDGKATEIVHLYQIAYPGTAYELTFSNGAKVVCGGEHKWSVSRSHSEGYKVKDTDSIVSEFSQGKKVYIPRVERIDLISEYTGVDPYCLGYWLGDGNSYRSAITTTDEEVVNRFSLQYRLVEIPPTIKTRAKSYNVWSLDTKHERDKETGCYLPDFSSFEYWLRTLNLLKVYGGEKHIPDIFFTAPYNVKLELVRGLMDADGYAYSGAFNVFTQTEGRLKDDFIKLLKSMGIKVNISKFISAVEFNRRKASYKNKGLPVIARTDLYKIGFTCNDNPFFISRKASKYKQPKYTNTYKLVDVKVVPKVLMRCLEVDSPDHLFIITDDYILTHNSVGGIRSALDSTAKREASILRRLADGLKEIGKKIIAMNSVWLSDEEVIRITDEEFVAIKRSDLAGNFDLALSVSTAEENNQKAGEITFMLQTMGNSMPMDLTKILLVKAAELRKMPDLAKAIAAYEPKPDPLVVAKAELEVELLKAQVQNEQAKAQENMADIELKMAKTESERAKANKATSEKDKLDLDYVEQASGLQQERELEKQQLGLEFKDRINKQSKIDN